MRLASCGVWGAAAAASFRESATAVITAYVTCALPGEGAASGRVSIDCSIARRVSRRTSEGMAIAGRAIR